MPRNRTSDKYENNAILWCRRRTIYYSDKRSSVSWKWISGSHWISISFSYQYANICPGSCPGDKWLNGAKFGWKTKAHKSSNYGKSGENIMNAEKYATIQKFCPGSRPRSNMRIMLFYGAEEGPLTTQIKGSRWAGHEYQVQTGYLAVFPTNMLIFVRVPVPGQNVWMGLNLAGKLRLKRVQIAEIPMQISWCGQICSHSNIFPWERTSDKYENKAVLWCRRRAIYYSD